MDGMDFRPPWLNLAELKGIEICGPPILSESFLILEVMNSSVPKFEFHGLFSLGFEIPSKSSFKSAARWFDLKLTCDEITGNYEDSIDFFVVLKKESCRGEFSRVIFEASFSADYDS